MPLEAQKPKVKHCPNLRYYADFSFTDNELESREIGNDSAHSAIASIRISISVWEFGKASIRTNIKHSEKNPGHSEMKDALCGMPRNPKDLGSHTVVNASDYA